MSDLHPPASQGLEKMPTGIKGFDEITRGGLPRNATTLLIGGPGTGKTVFALQSLVNGARLWEEPGIFVAFEETSDRILTNTASFGWELQSLQKEDLLFFPDGRLPPNTITAGHFDLNGLLASLAARARQMSAAHGGAPVRIVFDAIDVLLSLLDDPIAERQELYKIHDWLEQNRFTGIITNKVHLNDPHSQIHYGFLQFMSDCIVQLEQYHEERFSHRRLSIVKYRGSSFSENEFPFVLGRSGIEMLDFGVVSMDYPAYTERVTSGVERLDTMLGGGYLRGTSTIITGAPGTAKSTLAGSFIDAACRRGERCIYLSFDEGPGEIIRNQASVDIHLSPHVESGLLHMASIRVDARSAEEHLVAFENLVEQHRPRCLVIDPVSALNKVGGPKIALAVAQRLIHLSKLHGITTVFTSLVDDYPTNIEATPLQISTVADTWIHLSYFPLGGERNRALTIIKARGIAHSNQVRELILSDQGVTLTDVYTAGGEVLMGTLRYEKELSERHNQERRQAEIERRRRELQLAQAENVARLQAIQRQIEAQQAELTILDSEKTQNKDTLQEQEEAIGRRRGEDVGFQAGNISKPDDANGS